MKRFSREGWRIITCSREDVPEECGRDPNWTLTRVDAILDA